MATLNIAGIDRPVQLVSIIDPSGSTGPSTPVSSTLNSTTAVLAGGATFTGTAESVTGYSDVRVSVFASHASATDGLALQQSIDGTNWDFVDSYTIPAASGKAFGVGVNANWFRAVYTNGATLQTSFRLQSRFLAAHNKSSSVRPQDARSNENDMEENLAYSLVFNGASWDRQRIGPYQVAQTPIIGKSGNVANGSAAATLTGTATTTVYLAGFEITGSGAVAGLPVTVTVTGLLGGTIQYTYAFAAGVLLSNAPLVVPFSPPLPAAAVNTPIVVTCPAGGTGTTNNTVTAHGYYQ